MQDSIHDVRMDIHEELLGMFLKEPERMCEYPDLQKSDFVGYENLFESMRKLSDEGRLSVRNLIAVMPDYMDTVKELMRGVLTCYLMDERVAEVRRNRLKLKMRLAIAAASSDLNNRNPDDVYRSLIKALDRMRTVESINEVDQKKGVQEWLAWMDEIRTDPSKAFGLRTGIADLDMLTTGFHRHDLSVVGARTSMGKSAFMLEMVLRLQRKGYKTALFSLEMTRRQILNRMIANLTNTVLSNLKKGEIDDALFERMKHHVPFLESIMIDDTRGVTADYITDCMRRLKRKQGLDFVVVDYLQDVKEKGEEQDNQGSALARVCRKLRQGAYECDCHVMALSQVKREVENRNDKRPMNSDLSGSTGIETSADVIALLYRDEYYNPKTDKYGIIEVNFTKQRNGGTGRVELRYDKDTQRMRGRYE